MIYATRSPTTPQQLKERKESSMEPATTVASTLGTVIVVIFMVVVGYGAYLVVSDSEKRWKERYGNRWFVTRSEKDRLDKAYAERKAAQKE